MPQTVGNVHVDALLSTLARLYRPLDAGFIADEVCQYLPVAKESDLYPVFSQGDFYGTDVDDLVADRSAPKFIEFSHDKERYQVARRELAWDISDRERGNADDQIRLERNKQVGTLGRLGLKREIRVAALLRKTTNGGQLALGAAAANKWDGAATTYQQIWADVSTGKEAMRQSIGVRPNVIVIPEAVAQGMHKSLFPSVIQYTYGSASDRPLVSEMYPALPPVLFGMRVLLPGVIKNTAAEGLTETYSDIWDEQVRLLYVTSGPDIDTPSVAYTFRTEQPVTRRWRDEEKRKDNFAAGQTIDERVVAPYAGYEIDNCLT